MDALIPHQFVEKKISEKKFRNKKLSNLEKKSYFFNFFSWNSKIPLVIFGADFWSRFFPKKVVPGMLISSNEVDRPTFFPTFSRKNRPIHPPILKKSKNRSTRGVRDRELEIECLDRELDWGRYKKRVRDNELHIQS